jgi:hypothetical protein
VIEMRRVMAALAAMYPAFGDTVAQLDAGCDRLLAACKQSLLRDYLRSHDVEEVKAISETLGAIIAAGKWPDWQLDFDMAIEERCQSPAKAG